MNSNSTFLSSLVVSELKTFLKVYNVFYSQTFQAKVVPAIYYMPTNPTYILLNIRCTPTFDP
jgi:hypothetical protein